MNHQLKTLLFQDDEICIKGTGLDKATKTHQVACGDPQLYSGLLMIFATPPEGQITYYRPADTGPCKIHKSVLLHMKSISMYGTLLYLR